MQRLNKVGINSCPYRQKLLDFMILKLCIPRMSINVLVRREQDLAKAMARWRSPCQSLLESMEALPFPLTHFFLSSGLTDDLSHV